MENIKIASIYHEKFYQFFFSTVKITKQKVRRAGEKEENEKEFSSL